MIFSVALLSEHKELLSYIVKSYIAYVRQYALERVQLVLIHIRFDDTGEKPVKHRLSKSVCQKEM